MEMKKITLLCTIWSCAIALAFAQEEMVAGWTFPGNSLAADTGIAINLSQEFLTMGETSPIELKNGYTTKAAQASGWNDGMNTKAWVITLSTKGYVNLTLSSRQQSGGTDPGPEFFKLQYSIDGGAVWENIPGGEITVQNDWETSNVDLLELPEACNDLDALKVRWLMTSNEASGAGGLVQENGKSKIDEVFIRGEMINSVATIRIHDFAILPNPSGRSITIRSQDKMKHVFIRSLDGKLIREVKASKNILVVDLAELPSGCLIVVTVVPDSRAAPVSKKYFLP